MYKLMLIEDDQSLCSQIADGLTRWGFDVFTVKDFHHIIEEYGSINPHLVIMDINLPYFDGFYWCSKIREISRVPILFLSSRDTSMDIVMAVNMGGDDFIAKPFSMDVLLAKLNALLRRTYSYMENFSELMEHRGAVLNLSDNTVVYKENKIELTKNEFQIMVLLMKNHGKIVSREKIMRALWADESFIDDNTLTVNVNRLRSKLEDLGLLDYIATKKGQGYGVL